MVGGDRGGHGMVVVKVSGGDGRCGGECGGKGCIGRDMKNTEKLTKQRGENFAIKRIIN